MASPYDGIEEADLLLIKSHLLKVLSGQRYLSQAFPGLSYARRVDSLEQARTELVYVQQALDALDPDKAPVTRSFLKAV